MLMTRVKDEHVTDMYCSNIGVDMHNPSPVWSYTVLNVEEFTEDAIMTELKAKRTSFIYDAYPAYGYEKKRYHFF